METALIIGDPAEDISGRLFQRSFEDRGVNVTWKSMAEAMGQLRCGDSSLLDVFHRNVPAGALDVREISLSPESDLCSYQYMVIVNSKDYLTYTSFFSRAVEACGVVFPNTSSSILLSCNKWTTYVRMREADLAMPTSELVYTVEEASRAAEHLRYPVVVKDPFGARGQGVELAHTVTDLVRIVDELRLTEQPLLLQQYIECAAQDKRLIYVDGELCTAMLRRGAAGEFRSNLAMGGTAHQCEVSEEERVLAKGVVSALGLAVAGLDIATVTEVLPGRDYLPLGAPFCLEANPIPAFDVVYELNHVDGTLSVVEMMMRRRTRPMMDGFIS